MILLGQSETSAKAEPYRLDPESLKQHVLITGRSVAGKTNTCWQLIDQLSLEKTPFIVIETAGKNYRRLSNQLSLLNGEPLRILSIWDDSKEPLRFNPLRVEPHVRILSHIQSVVSFTTASYNLSVTASKVLEKALYALYTAHGWNLFRNSNLRLTNDKFPAEAYPTILELLEFLQSISFTNSLGSPPPQELVRAIDTLVTGSKGAVFNTKSALPKEFFDTEKQLIECDAVGDLRDKCFLVSMLLLQIQEHHQKPGFETSRVIVIDDAINLTYLMGLPGRRVGDDQKEDRWIPLAGMLTNFRRLNLNVIVSMQANTKITADFLGLFGTRIFHQIEVQQARQIAEFMPKQIKEEDLYDNPPGSAWVVNPQRPQFSLVKIPQINLDNSVTVLEPRPDAFPNCRFSGCSSYPNACDDNTFSNAREVAESQAFRTVYINYILSCQKDLTQLVHYRGRLIGELQSQIGRRFPNLVDISWCTICQVTEWYFDLLARDHGWPYEALTTQKEAWLNMLRPAFIKDWPTRRINMNDLKLWREEFWNLKERDQGPLPLCGECNAKCRYGSDIHEILKDTRNENDFFKTLSNDSESLSEAAAWFCWMFSERLMCEPDVDLAYCLSAHFLGRANLSVDAQLVFAHKTRQKLEETKLKAEGETVTQEPENPEESEKEKRRQRSRERRKNRPEGDGPPLKPVP